MPGLADSRWAPKYNHAISYTKSARSSNGYGSSSTTTQTTSTTTTSTTTTTQSLPQLPASYNELTRYTKIVRRLKWKLPYLASGYRQAVDRVGPHVDQSRVAEAELMFKIDFFEYYMLIERALVHLLGVFGITVSPSFSSSSHHRNGGADAPPNGGYHHSHRHRYHANVLEALDNPDNPLHEALGSGDVRRQLWRAKDLRNRWKNVDDPNGLGGRNGNYKGAATESAPLESYDLEHILVIIFEGFDRAFAIAEQFVLTEMQRGRSQVEGGVDGQSGGVVHMMDGFEPAASEEQEWEFIVEAMDWEAV
ncbi:hypothetical protein NKR19_g9145 [Coniochaeta hoffmannii]|uniref:Fungal specific transcription factor n=1 Tax=Coniochaeta hoffmannii TaxID=91930 RepID=A0AA38VHX0_9PEZI|nr:hypothetical protein NKR19_g9145 [Coniochaeta hoffmannii]